MSSQCAGALGLCWAPTRSRPGGAESGDDRSDPKTQCGFKVGQQPAAGGEPQTEAAAPGHPPRVRLTEALCFWRTCWWKESFAFKWNTPTAEWNKFLKMFNPGSCLVGFLVYMQILSAFNSSCLLFISTALSQCNIISGRIWEYSTQCCILGIQAWRTLFKLFTITMIFLN